jgi:hypothetical protein
MIVRLQVKTPLGKAAGAERTLRLFILGKMKQPVNTYVSEEDDVFFWEITVTPSQYVNISKRVAMFHALASGVLGQVERTKMLRKAAEMYAGKDEVTPEAFRETRTLFDTTEVTLIKTATAQELMDDGETYWARVKRVFRRKTE